MTDNSFYVYVHRRLDTGEPFYYGRGKGKRAWEPYRNEWHSNVVKTHGIIVEIITSDLTKDEADKLEIKLIAEARIRGENIVNIRPGGQGYDSETGAKAGSKGGATNARLKRGVCDPLVQAKGCSAGGKATFERGIGVFDPKALSINGSKGGKIGGVITGPIVGAMCRDLRIGICAPGVASKGGKIGGVITSSQRWKCDECDMITNAGSLTGHQRRTGHKGKTRLS